jgi:hypothetical protein
VNDKTAEHEKQCHAETAGPPARDGHRANGSVT